MLNVITVIKIKIQCLKQEDTQRRIGKKADWEKANSLRKLNLHPIWVEEPNVYSIILYNLFEH